MVPRHYFLNLGKGVDTSYSPRPHWLILFSWCVCSFPRSPIFPFTPKPQTYSSTAKKRHLVWAWPPSPSPLLSGEAVAWGPGCNQLSSSYTPKQLHYEWGKYFESAGPALKPEGTRRKGCELELLKSWVLALISASSPISCLFSVSRHFSEIFMCCPLVGSSMVPFSLVLVVSFYLIWRPLPFLYFLVPSFLCFICSLSCWFLPLFLLCLVLGCIFAGRISWHTI